MKKDFIGFKGEKKVWDKFTLKLKKEKREVWEVIKPFLEKYIKGETNENKRDKSSPDRGH